MHAYRSHNCGELRESAVGETVKLSGWVHRKRDHGNLLFVDLRDHFGITQIVTDVADAAFKPLESVRVESVVTVTGKVVRRASECGQSEPADRPDRDPRRGGRNPVGGAGIAAPGVRRAGLSRGYPPALPLPSTCGATGCTPISC